jgi:hypothetical protein
MKKHLFYNLCAFAKNNEWKRNIDELAPYLPVFDGRLLVVIRTGDDLVDPDTVKAYFPAEAEFVCLPNNARLGEVDHFIELLETFAPLAEDEALFYAHTKGVRHEREPHQMWPIVKWRRYMLKECLSDPKSIDIVLSLNPCCGTYFWQESKTNARFIPFRQYRHWHFAGAFWWVNLKRLFAKPDWRRMNNNRFGLEDYLPLHFKPEEAFKLGLPRPERPYDMAWVYHCRACGVSFSAMTSVDHPARPPCVLCKKPSEPEALYVE